MFSLHGPSKEKFPFTYFHLLVLHLPIDHLIVTLQDFRAIKATFCCFLKYSLLIFFCSILDTGMLALCSMFKGKEVQKSLNFQ